MRETIQSLLRNPLLHYQVLSPRGNDNGRHDARATDDVRPWEGLPEDEIRKAHRCNGEDAGEDRRFRFPRLMNNNPDLTNNKGDYEPGDGRKPAYVVPT